MSAPDNASDEAPKNPLAHGAVIHVARSRPRDSHREFGDIAGRHVQARVHPLPHPELVVLQCLAAGAWVADRPLTDSALRSNVTKGWFDTSTPRHLDPSTPWHAAPSGKRGAQPVYSGEEGQETVQWTVSPTNAIQACLTVKVLFGLPLRQMTGFVASLLRLAGLDRPVPFVGRSFSWKAR